MNNSFKLMRARLELQGGELQQDRMIKDKLKSLNRALYYSYQGAQVRKLGSEKVERALINPNTVKQDYDDKIISISYESGYKLGTVFEWVNTGTKWLIYLQDLTELAYFRGDIRKCTHEIKWKVNDETFSTFAAIRGPTEANINSTEKNDISIDLPNHSLGILMPATAKTLQYFKRYSKFYIQPPQEGDTPICWRVEATDTVSMPGILQLTAYEYYTNEQADDVENGVVDAYGEEVPQPQDETIQGETFIKPKKSYTYEYVGTEESAWSYDSRLPISAEIIDKKITIKWTATYTGQFVLQYGTQEKTIVVESLF